MRQSSQIIKPLTQLGSHLVRLKKSLESTSDTPGLDAQVLLAHILGVGRAWVIGHPEAELDDQQEQALEGALLRLAAGQPLPYVLGEWEFFGLSFVLTPQVLIPRPETELLVELALAWLDENPDRRRAVDVGTGSGCIAITLAVKVSDLQVAVVDCSAEALKVARRNAHRHNVQDQVQLIQTDLIDVLEGPFDLICANLPYIPKSTLKNLAVFRREPTLALDGGLRGLDLIERLLKQSPSRLARGGLLLLEIEASQGAEVHTLACEAFPGAEVQVLADLAGHDRVVRIKT